MDAPAPYVILSTQRVGSHLLGDILDGHPMFAQGGEVLIPQTRKPGSFDLFLEANGPCAAPDVLWRRYLHHLKKTKPGADHVGFLVKYGHVNRILEKNLISDSLFAGVRIIHLTRRNVLRTVASHHLAVARKVHVTRQSIDHDVNSVELPASTIVDILRKKASSVETIKKRLADRPLTLEVAYEDMMDGQEVQKGLIDNLKDFFKVPDRFNHKPRTIKLAPTRLRSLLTNYPEIVSAVDGTEFEHMLD